MIALDDGVTLTITIALLGLFLYPYLPLLCLT